MARPVPFSLPQEIVDAARKQRESAAMSTITSDIDSSLSQGFSGLQGIAQQAAQPLEHFAQSVASGGISVPTLEDLTPDWVKREQQRASEAVSTITTGTLGVQVPSMDDLTPQSLGSARDVRRATSQPQSSGTTLTGPPAPRAGGSGAPEPLGEIAEGDPQRYFATAGPYARQVERETGVPAALSLAISANETGYGQKRYQAGANNYHGIQALSGEPGAVPYKDWRPGPGGQQEFYNAAQRSFATPLDGFRGFANFLTQNPRYAPALDRYRQTGDVNQLAADVHKAGYAEDPAYTTKITSIMRGIPVSTGVGEVTDTRGVPLATAPQQRPAPAPAAPQAQSSGPPTQRQAPASDVRLQGITPPQFGLGDADAEAICGPVLAMAFAKAAGRSPTIAEAKQMAAQHGMWTRAAGMGGPEAMAQTLRAMDIPAHYAPGPLDVETIRRETQNGNPVGINTQGHYFVVEGVDDQGRLDLGNSAKALRASGGRQWFTPAEIPGLGMGAPTGALYKDSPASPVPSVAVQVTQMPTVSAALRQAPAPAPASAPRPVPFAPTAPPVRDDWRQQPGISVPTLAQLHPNVSSAFVQANGREPTPDEAAELAALGYGVG